MFPSSRVGFPDNLYMPKVRFIYPLLIKFLTEELSVIVLTYDSQNPISNKLYHHPISYKHLVKKRPLIKKPKNTYHMELSHNTHIINPLEKINFLEKKKNHRSSNKKYDQEKINRKYKKFMRKKERSFNRDIKNNHVNDLEYLRDENNKIEESIIMGLNLREILCSWYWARTDSWI